MLSLQPTACELGIFEVPVSARRHKEVAGTELDVRGDLISLISYFSVCHLQAPAVAQKSISSCQLRLLADSDNLFSLIAARPSSEDPLKQAPEPTQRFTAFLTVSLTLLLGKRVSTWFPSSSHRLFSARLQKLGFLPHRLLEPQIQPVMQQDLFL